MDSKEIQILVEKFIENSSSSAEEETLMTWYRSANEQELEWLSGFADERELTRLQILAVINRKIGHLPDRHLVWQRIAAAASILLCLSIGGYFLLHHKQVNQQIAQNKKQDILPGSNKATLTLGNGQKIILSNGLSGQLAQQGVMAIKIKNNNAIAYVSSPTSNTDNSFIVYNTLSTSKGEQSPYPLILSDGTKIWLNAASSVTFPTVFVGKDRLVNVTGEAYFEVAHNAAHPFKIAVKGQIIEDIGTNFNINAYDNEPAIKTTLLEGSVRIIKATEAAIIKPGQQAITHMGSNLIAIQNADLEEAMAWKNGLFLFKKADMQTVMRQLERWYNVEVVYEGKVPQREFNGDIHRNLNASQVLDVLSYYRVHFRIDGKKIIVKE